MTSVKTKIKNTFNPLNLSLSDDSFIVDKKVKDISRQELLNQNPLGDFTDFFKVIKHWTEK
jgi:hypothetical protein